MQFISGSVSKVAQQAGSVAGVSVVLSEGLKGSLPFILLSPSSASHPIGAPLCFFFFFFPPFVSLVFSSFGDHAFLLFSFSLLLQRWIFAAIPL